MVYATASRAVFHSARSLLQGTTSVISDKRIETSDPKELGEKYLKAELGLGEGSTDNSGTPVNNNHEDKKPFARPKGPPRRR
jgi:twinfilin-like protein